MILSWMQPKALWEKNLRNLRVVHTVFSQVQQDKNNKQIIQPIFRLHISTEKKLITTCYDSNSVVSEFYIDHENTTVTKHSSSVQIQRNRVACMYTVHGNLAFTVQSEIFATGTQNDKCNYSGIIITRIPQLFRNKQLHSIFLPLFAQFWLFHVSKRLTLACVWAVRRLNSLKPILQKEIAWKKVAFQFCFHPFLLLEKCLWKCSRLNQE